MFGDARAHRPLNTMSSVLNVRAEPGVDKKLRIRSNIEPI